MRVGEKIAPKTIHEELNLLKTIIKKAVDYGRLATEPMMLKFYPKIEVDTTREKFSQIKNWDAFYKNAHFGCGELLL